MLKHEDIVSSDYAPTCMTKELAESGLDALYRR